MKNTIDRISQKPLERVRNKSDDQLQMENINLKIKQNDPKAQMDDLAGGSQRDMASCEQKPTKREVTDLWNQMDLLDDQIKHLKDVTSVGLHN